MPCIISGFQIYQYASEKFWICPDEIPKFALEYCGKRRSITVRKILPLIFIPRQMDPIHNLMHFLFSFLSILLTRVGSTW